MRYFLAIAALSLLLLAGCGKTGRKGEAVIHGKLVNDGGARLYLQELLPAEPTTPDSVITGKDGSFSFTFLPAEKGFYMLRTGGGKRLVVVAGKGDSLEVTGDYRIFPRGARVRGNTESEDLAAFFSVTEENRARADSMQRLVAAGRDLPGFAALMVRADSVMQSVLDSQAALERRYITAHPDYLSSLLVLNFSFGPGPVLEPAANPDLYRLLDSTLSRAFPGNPNVVFHRKRLEEFSRGGGQAGRKP